MSEAGALIRASPVPTRRLAAEENDAEGSASVMALGVGLALLLVALGLQSIGAAAVARHRAGLAADLTALSAALHTAEGPAAACDRARTLAAGNGAALIRCTVDATIVTVTVTVAPTGPAALIDHASATARAGPINGPPGRSR